MKKIHLRRDLTDLSGTQRDTLRDALLTLKTQGKYDKYADQHDTYFGDAHGNPFFFPWHRKFLSNLEKELQVINPDIALPYWDWRNDTSTSALPWTADFMGGTGDPVTGPFAGWGIRRSLGGFLPSAQDVADDQILTPYSNFWSPSEDTHGPPHGWVGGNMVSTRSPEDPIFFMHHCFVDKWWSDWQNSNPGLDAYEGGGSRSPTSPMPPWSTQPNDMLDTVDLDYMYDTDPPRIELKTSSLSFIDIPEGEETVRGVTFEVVTNTLLSFNITAGPGADFNTPFGTSISVDPGNGAVRGDAIHWISYRGTDDGDTASGSVTITCPQTSESWTLSISANTVERPTVGVALVLDKSQSMENDVGDGRSRSDLLVYAANIFANVIQDENGIGIAAFDHDANKVMDIEDAGPPMSVTAFGTGRSTAIAHIGAHTPNPLGATSIGDGVEMGNSIIAAASASYDEMAMLVFTDGKENRDKTIAQVSDLIGARVFAIGLGTASDLNPAALTELCNNSGGEMYLTDVIDPQDDFFKLTKYYLQVLAGITNTDIVTDPEDWILPGDKHRIPFTLNETDISHDVVLLCPAANVVRMTLETPTGDVVDPAFAGSAIGVTYVPGSTFSYYRVTLPVVGASGQAAQEGTWHAVLEVDPVHYKRYLKLLSKQKELQQRVAAYGVRYNVSVYALSNLRLRGTLSQNSYEPGSQLTLRGTLTEYGLPLAGSADLTAELTRPDGTVSTLQLTKLEVGVFELQTSANMPGVYTAYMKAEGETARGREFTRERLFTGAVWKGGDEPPPSTFDDDPGRDNKCLCALLRCLLSEKVLTRRFEKKLADEGIELDVARRCVEAWCRCGKRQPPVGTVEAKGLIAMLENQPELVTTLRTLLSGLANDDEDR